MCEGPLGAYRDAVSTVKAQFISVAGGFGDLVRFYFDDFNGALLGAGPASNTFLIDSEQAQ
jgi:hypothetical protein